MGGREVLSIPFAVALATAVPCSAFAQSDTNPDNLPLVRQFTRLTLEDAPGCDHTFPIQASEVESHSRASHWGGILYVEQNSEGDLLLSSCPRVSGDRTAPCQNLFRGTASALCRSERNAARMEDVIVGGFETGLSLLPATTVPMMVYGAAQTVRDESRGNGALTRAVNVLRGRESPPQPDTCPLSRALLARMAQPENGVVQSSQYVRMASSRSSSCPLRGPIALFSRFTPTQAFPSISEPKIEVMSNESQTAPFRISNRGDGSWYRSFQSNEESAQAALRLRGPRTTSGRPAEPTPVYFVPAGAARQ